MKKVITLLFSIYLLPALAQEPRPEWVRQPPFPPKSANFILVYGMGTGKTEQQAEFAAWKNAFYKALNEGGLMGIQAQAKTLDGVLTMNELETRIPVNVMQRRLVCETLPIYLAGGEVKVYVLLQVQRRGNISNDFSDYGRLVDCETRDFKDALKEWNKGAVERQKKERARQEKERAQQEKEKERARKKEQRDRDRYENGSYLGGGVYTRFPYFSLGGSFIGRHGGTVGIGYTLSIGGDFHFDTPSREVADDGSAYGAYLAELKLFPYKGLFFSAGYGTLGCEKVSRFNDSDGRWALSGMRNGKGFPAMAGYEIVFESGFLLSIGAGMSYDTFTNGWRPMIKFTIGGVGRL
jgi:hypothetical protein